MAPFWDPDARGAVVGLGTGHGRGHWWRAMLEGVALDCAMGYGAIEAATGEPITELLTIGGGARSALMRQIVADATGRPVRDLEHAGGELPGCRHARGQRCRLVREPGRGVAPRCRARSS